MSRERLEDVTDNNELLEIQTDYEVLVFFSWNMINLEYDLYTNTSHVILHLLHFK